MTGTKQSLNNIKVEYYIIFLWANDVIMRIDRINSITINKYLYDKSKTGFYTHYSLENVNESNADNKKAEYILKYKPGDNNTLPYNNMFISNHQARSKYKVYKNDFKKMIKESGGYEFNGVLYMKINDFIAIKD
ncbi:MAG: hypothetical protein WCQ65_12035 [Fermentimonas sp.]|jgi:hypothetical protein